MGRERNDETGRFEEVFSREDFIDALAAHDGGASTQEVSYAVDCAYRTAIARLHNLEDEGVVNSRRVGNALLWELDTEDDNEE